MVQVTDCRSLYDLLNKRGARPEEQRLLLDIEAIREQKELTGLQTRWVNTKQMLADCLTKDDFKAGDYLRHVVATGYLHLTEHPDIEGVLHQEREQAKAGRQAFYDAKYPGKRTKKEITMTAFDDEGWSTSLGCSVLTKLKPKFAVAPSAARTWRLTMADCGLGCWKDLGQENWHELPLAERRRRIPKQVFRTLSVFAKGREDLEKWKNEFMKNKCEEFEIGDESEDGEEHPVAAISVSPSDRVVCPYGVISLRGPNAGLANQLRTDAEECLSTKQDECRGTHDQHADDDDDGDLVLTAFVADAVTPPSQQCSSSYPR
jgi:hypothetical protein